MSYKVQETIEQLNGAINQNKELFHETTQKLRNLREEEAALQEDRNVSERQKQSLNYFRVNGVEAFPLRRLSN